MTQAYKEATARTIYPFNDRLHSDGPYNSYQSGGSIGTANIGGPLSIGTSSTVSVGQFAQLNVSAINCNTPNPVIDGANGSNFLLPELSN
jgi:hypothetical protein